MTSSSVNPITVEVVRNGLAHIANEMATVLRKTSYNMMIYEVRDYCVGIVDPEGSILSQNFGALPIFLADLGPAVVDGVRMHGQDGFRPGDVLLMNHPYVCGQHLNNVVVYTPFFYDGELVAFLAVRAHWIDIGGTRVGFGFSGTREVYEEGLQFRSLKLYRGDKPNQDIFQIITDNVRFAESCLGDLRAQIAACRVGDRGLGALVDRYGLKTFLGAVKTIWRQSETLAREQVARGDDLVANLRPSMVRLDSTPALELLRLLDGTRDRNAILHDLAIRMTEHPVPTGNGDDRETHPAEWWRGQLAPTLEQALDLCVRNALLVGE